MSSVEKLIKILIAVFIFLDCLLIGGMAFLLFDEIWRSLLRWFKMHFLGGFTMRRPLA